MTDTIISNTMMIVLQGEEALRLVELNHDYARYNVLGFDQVKVFITDRREVGMNAIYQVLETGNTSDFASIFSTPAYALVTLLDNSSIEIDLYETTSTSFDTMLWIVVGMPGAIPIYNYLYYHYEQIGQDLYSFLSIYSIEPEEKTEDQQVLPLAVPSAC